jgi:hypothetical protein
MQLRAKRFVGVYGIRWKGVMLVVLLMVLVISAGTSMSRRMQQSHFSITPGAQAIVFTSGRDRAINLYVMYPDGTQQTRLTNLRRRSPQWWIPSFLVPYGDLVTNRRPLPASDGQGVTFCIR